MTIPDERLAQLAARFSELEARLASGTLEGEAFVAASRDYSELEPVAQAASQVRAMRGELAGLEALDDADPEMKALAEEEIARLRTELKVPAIEDEPRHAYGKAPFDAPGQTPGAGMGVKP